MIKMTATNAVVSKGYNGADALRFSENGENKSVRFRIGVSVYDKNAEKNRRYVNIGVKAFNGMCSRIESMKLDGGAYVNVTGRYDEEFWEDQITHEKKSASVLIVDDIEFCHNGGNGNRTGEDGGAAHPGAPGAVSGDRKQTPPAEADDRQPDNFTGFESFGGANPFFPAN
jgi:single-stranded DNA-binding protein